MFTVLTSGVVGARTIAFEPAPYAFGYLVKNIGLNNLSARVSARNVALGSRIGKTEITAGLGTENYVVQGKGGPESVTVDLSTLDALDTGLEPVAVKIDVEGFESEVLAGAKSFLAKPFLRVLIVERAGNASRFGQDESALHGYIRSLSFIPCGYTPSTRALHPIHPDTTGCNIIYVRNPDQAKDRLLSAPPYRFAGQSI